MKSINIILLFAISLSLSLAACSTDSDPDDKIFRNQTGQFRWAGAPAQDGAGLLFEVNDDIYGVSGVPSDYPGFFNNVITSVEVEADFRLTGEQTVRGWGVTFPEIEFLRVQKRESS